MVRKHLAVLAHAGLVEGHRHGREIRYTVRPERLDAAAQAMAATARWDRRLHAIKRLAEAQARTTITQLPQPAACQAGRNGRFSACRSAAETLCTAGPPKTRGRKPESDDMRVTIGTADTTMGRAESAIGAEGLCSLLGSPVTFCDGYHAGFVTASGQIGPAGALAPGCLLCPTGSLV